MSWLVWRLEVSLMGMDLQVEAVMDMHLVNIFVEGPEIELLSCASVTAA